MKKTISLILALALALGLGTSAIAEGMTASSAAAETPLLSGAEAAGESGQQDEAMKQVILAVKKTLALNTDDYSGFNGDSYVRGQQSRWSLNWYNDDNSLYIEADEAGKVYSYACYSYNYSPYDGGSKGLHFPAYTFDDAVRDGEAFLNRVLTDGESVRWEESTENLRGSSRYYLSGVLCLNGLPTESYISVSLNTADGSVQSFWRGDAGQFITGELPSPTPAFDAETALGKFAPYVTATPEWILSDDSGTEARLMYVISRDYDLLLDAQTGLAVEASASRGYDTGKGEMNDAVAEEAESEATLTEIEIQGAEKFEGVLDAAALLAAAKAEKAFGITDGFQISNVRYRADAVTEDPERAEAGAEPDMGVTATYSLRCVLSGPAFGLSQAEYDELLAEGWQPAVTKYLSADAHTGEVEYLYTFYNGFGWDERKDTVTPEISQTAQTFLKERYASYLPQTELQSANQSRWGVPVNSFRYVRMHDGYPMNANSIGVTVNAATGFVDGFDCSWNEDVVFGPSAPLVGEAAAVESYLNTFRAELGYSLLPVNADDWETPYYRLLTYSLQSDSWCSQVDAITGEAKVTLLGEGQTKPVYSDLESSYAAAEIRKLADFGIGFYGVETIEPKKRVTELDMLLFLLSANGYRYDGETSRDADTLNRIYRNAYSEGYIMTLEQNPDRFVTRSELCRSFVALAGMREAAELKGIYACGFADDASIAAEDYGYVAIAKGLGIVSGDAAGTFRPNDGATRQELALMLYRYLSR